MSTEIRVAVAVVIAVAIVVVVVVVAVDVVDFVIVGASIDNVVDFVDIGGMIVIVTVGCIVAHYWMVVIVTNSGNSFRERV